MTEQDHLTAQADWPIDVRLLESVRNPIAEAWNLDRYFHDFAKADIQAPFFFLKG